MTKHFPSSKVKRLTAQGLLAVSVVGLGAAGVVTLMSSSNPVEAAQVQEQQGAAVDLLTYSRVEAVRREAGLTNKDLAALGVTGEEASAVLTRLVQWSRDNEAVITKARQAVNKAKRDLREQQRLVRIGQASQRQLTDSDGKAQSVSDAEQAYRNMLSTGGAYAMQAPRIASSKSTAWQGSAALKGQVHSDLRYLSRMDASRLELLQSEAKRQGVALEKVLFLTEQQELKAVRSRISTNMPAVLVAEAVVLPVPEELRGDELLLEDSLEAE